MKLQVGFLTVSTVLLLGYAGEALIVASLRVLHGRESFVPSGKRYLQDAYFFYDNALNNSVI